MKRYLLDCRLLDEVVVSERGATTGSHRTLDYLPGACFLGAAAKALYAELDAGDAFMVFHSGHVRFCNALPAADGEIGRPVPLALHERKGEPADRQRPQGERLFNFCHPQGQAECRQNGAQPRQLRTGWLTGSGRLLHVGRSYRMKTAVEATTGRAAEGQLFGYESLHAGQRFIGEVQLDACIPASLQARLVACLDGVLRVGRSRSAQYGRVACRVEALPDTAGLPLAGDRLALWLQSDLACDRAGVPTFTPSLAELGLETGGTLDAGASFIRTRSYAPYNAHRRLPDLERQVISAGSVLVYRLDSAPAASDAARLAAGLGNWRECGLGQVVVNPPLLAAVHPVFAEARPSGQVEWTSSPPAPADHPLLAWLLAGSGAAEAEARVKAWVEAQVPAWVQRQESARRFNGIAEFELAGPSRTQWGAVREKARLARSDRASLDRQLFAQDAGLCRGGQDWELPLGSGWNDHKDLRGWLRASIAELDPAVNCGLAVARLAGAIEQALSDGSWRRIRVDRQGGQDVC